MIRLGILRGCCRNGVCLGARERRPHGGHNPLRNVTLDREGVIENPVVALRPEVRFGHRVDEPDKPPEPVPLDLDVALHDAPDSQLIGDLAQRLRRGLVRAD